MATDNPLRQAVEASGDPELVPQKILDMYARGRRIAARRSLLKLNRGESDRARERLRADLLTRDAMWAQRIDGSPPTLFSFLGFGIRMAGRYDAEDDGFYTKTRAVTALFVPLFPLAAFLVRDSQYGGWDFYGRSRMPPRAQFQQLLVLGLVWLPVMAAAGAWAWQMETGDLIVVNGFDRAMTVDVDGAVYDIEPNGYATVEPWFSTSMAVTTSLVGSEIPLESLTISTAKWGNNTVYNPAGRALLSQRWVRWGPGDPPGPVDLWGDIVREVPAIDYVFVEPEDERWVEDGKIEEAAWLDHSLPEMNDRPLELANFLVHQGRDEVAGRFLRATLYDHPNNEGLLSAAMLTSPDPAALAVAHLAQHPDAVHAHRMVQRTSDPQEISARYSALASEHPNDPMFIYLAAAVHEGPVARLGYERALAFEPTYALAHRGLMYQDWREGDLAAAALRAERIIDLDPDRYWREQALRLGLAEGWPADRLKTLAGERTQGFDLATRIDLHLHPERQEAVLALVLNDYAENEWEDFGGVGPTAFTSWNAGDLHSMQVLEYEDAHPGLLDIALLYAMSTGREGWFFANYSNMILEMAPMCQPLVVVAAKAAGSDMTRALNAVENESYRHFLANPDTLTLDEIQLAGDGPPQTFAWAMLQMGVEDPEIRTKLRLAASTAFPWDLPRVDRKP